MAVGKTERDSRIVRNEEPSAASCLDMVSLRRRRRCTHQATRQDPLDDSWSDEFAASFLGPSLEESTERPGMVLICLLYRR